MKIAVRYILPLMLITVLGCAQTEPETPVELTEPIKEMIRIAGEEHQIPVTVTPFDRAVWIYLPLEENIFTIKASPKGPMSSDQSATKPAVKFIDCTWENRNFYLKYDIAPSKGYAKDYGYTSEFSEEFRTKQRFVLSAINRAYATDNNPPLFFILVMADIANGLESRTYLNYEDLKRAHVDHSFHEEYAKRVISDQPTGNINLIGDKTGQNVQYHDLSWPQFLAKQMVHRVNFKYQRSSFPPSDDARAELLNIAADTLGAYDFTNFNSIVLLDLNAQTTESVPANLLAQFKTEESRGRLIHLKFQP